MFTFLFIPTTCQENPIKLGVGQRGRASFCGLFEEEVLRETPTVFFSIEMATAVLSHRTFCGDRNILQQRGPVWWPLTPYGY